MSGTGKRHRMTGPRMPPMVLSPGGEVQHDAHALMTDID